MGDTTADFYVNLGEDAEWVGSIGHGGESVNIQRWYNLFEPEQDGVDYTEHTFREVVSEIVADAFVDKAGWEPARGHGWPWDYPTSTSTDMVYVFNNGTIHVFERGVDESGEPGQFLVAMHYPNGTRKPRVFPDMKAREAAREDALKEAEIR